MGSPHRSTQYDPNDSLARRVGSATRDPFTKRIIHGEVNEEGLPMGGGNTPKTGAGVSGGMTATPAWSRRFPGTTGKVAAGNLDTGAHPSVIRSAQPTGAPIAPAPGSSAPRPTNAFVRMAQQVAARAAGKAHAENNIAAKAPAWSTTGAGLRLGAAANSTVAAAAGAAMPAAGSITAPTPPRAFPRTPTPLENRFPGWENMSREERANVLRANPATSPNVGTTIGTGSSPFNFRGDRNIQSVGTEGEMGKEFDPTHDISRSHLAAGDSLLPRDSTGGVVVEPKYRTPGASIVGYTRPPSRSPFHPAAPAAPAQPPGVTDPRIALRTGAITGGFTPAPSPAPVAQTTPMASVWSRAIERAQGAATPFPGKDTAYSSSGGSFETPKFPAPAVSPIGQVAQRGAGKMLDRADVALATPPPTAFPGVDKEYSGSGGSLAPANPAHPATTIGDVAKTAVNSTQALAGLAFPKTPVTQRPAPSAPMPTTAANTAAMPPSVAPGRLQAAVPAPLQMGAKLPDEETLKRLRFGSPQASANWF